MDTSFVIGQIITDFEYFVASPPSEGVFFGDFADYSCNSQQDRAEYGVTIYLNRKMPDVSMPEVVNIIAHALEMKGFRPVLRRVDQGDPEIRVPYALRNMHPR
ncbi:MAG: hypothetical protein ABIR37_01005 [Candidatus Saccharimonadales bacterium]